MRGGRPGVPLDAEQEVRRHQDGLDGQADRILEGIALLLRSRGQTQERRDLARGHGAAIGPAREAGHDPAQAGRAVSAVEMAAGVDLLQACAGGYLDGLERTDDLEVTDAGLVRGR